MKTLADYNFDGEKALFDIIKNSNYKTIENAIASLTVFTNPRIVAQTKNKAIFRIRRAKSGEKRGSIIWDENVVVDDNTSPTTTFLLANKIPKSKTKNVQFNHIYPIPKPQNVTYYTSLANICMTPTFLAKLTDSNKNVIQLLRYRAFELYKGFVPAGFDVPIKPEGYENLKWAPSPEGIEDVYDCFCKKIERCPQSAIAKSVKAFGFGCGWSM